ncbi:MAG: zinc ABC transporter substrate-binding protein [Deltaproteobacteria bacterium]|nr:zinc ABC transporter substrate-binding protein [Deltaproteobacteria bacterium]
MQHSPPLQRQPFPLAFLVLFLLGGVEAGSAWGQQAPVEVVASVPPLGFLLERIGGDRVEVEVLIPPGHSPHSLELSPRDLVRLKRSRLVLQVGHESFLFEGRLLSALALQEPKVEVISMVAVDSDSHPWLSPRTLQATVESLKAALGRLDPAGVPEFDAAARQLTGEIEQVDRQISHLFQTSSCRSFVVDHPAWGSFAEHFLLEQLAVEQEGKDPGPASLARLSRRVQNLGLRTLFVEPGHSSSRNRALAKALRCKIQILDPMAPDVVENLWFVAQAIAGGCSSDSVATQP